MNSYYVNIRIGCWHYKMDFEYRLSKDYNHYHEGNPNKFNIYSFFGLEKSILKMFSK